MDDAEVQQAVLNFIDHYRFDNERGAAEEAASGREKKGS